MESMKSRISPFSVAAGILLTLSMMFLFVSLAAALGIWSYRPDELPLLGRKFWTFASVSWTLSVLIGTFFCVIAARSQSYRDGIANALATWSGSYLLFGGIALTMADSNLRTFLGSPMVGLFWNGFIGDAAALLAGIIGGGLGVLLERSLYEMEFHDGPIANTEVFRGLPRRS